jgi:hypothetical protein
VVESLGFLLGELQHFSCAFGELVKLCHYRGSPNRKRSQISTRERFYPLLAYEKCEYPDVLISAITTLHADD